MSLNKRKMNKIELLKNKIELINKQKKKNNNKKNQMMIFNKRLKFFKLLEQLMIKMNQLMMFQVIFKLRYF